ncbi:hypothetical protein [Streptomyces deccanensis]|uniref:hypothetical protein n=1 Tax=Streptomyces deccanensis TaxID=424188 RepID=UPI001EFB46D4|nr:hypothetical protein [Streptomyces deccanensis]ULR51213.1 hypothetical protein L3078_18980 [Streptomyces deccanensis]
MITAVDHVLLAAPPGTEDRLRAYYVGVLGMAEIQKPPALAVRGGCWFAAGDVVLHLGAEPGFRPPKKAHPGLRVRHAHHRVGGRCEGAGRWGFSRSSPRP